MLDKVQIKTKIISFDDYVYIAERFNPSIRIVQCHGVFDLLHIGHIRHFQAAKAHGDILVVTVTPDRYVNKGPNRPSFHETLRAEAIAALEFVDYVIINESPTAVEAINIIKPNAYVKGIEYKNFEQDLTAKIQDEVKAVQLAGGKVIFSDDITFSSSTLLNQYFPSFPKEVLIYLEQFKKRYSARTVLDFIERAKNLNVLVVGETIMDVYHFSTVIGKAGKEPILAAKHQIKEVYAGGILALANHLSDFCAEVTCLTFLGEDGEYEDFIRSQLPANVKLIPLYKKESPTIVKRRYVETYLQQKLFEVYEMNDDFLENNQQESFLGHLKSLLSTNDLSIVADYGHGLLDQESINLLMSDAKFLAVNTQSNASNHGFNCISKYTKADYVAIASRELQLNYRQKHLSVFEQLSKLMLDMQYDTALITTGKAGAYAARKNEDVCSVPAFATNIVDRVGAGDAVLAITSLLAYMKAPTEIIGFVGNVVGAEAVGFMGNKKHIEKVALMKHINHLLK